jgi:hypothetical protein
MRTLRWGMRGDDVQQLQQKLTDLGYNLGRVDGHFGYKTLSAVRLFQSATGLPVDGVAGPQTLQALGMTAAAGTSTTPNSTTTTSPGSNRAVSLHIGLNLVSPAGYNGWDGKLSGCEGDARTYESIAMAEGFATNHLLTPDATSKNVLDFVKQIATSLKSGDIFMFTYAGHGGQKPNNSADQEDDGMDETWCLYDRELLDDEINNALADFAPGVSIVLISDSCHSGTIQRGPGEPLEQFIARGRDYALAKESYYVGKTVQATSSRAAFDPFRSFEFVPGPPTVRPVLPATRGLEIGPDVRRPLSRLVGAGAGGSSSRLDVNLDLGGGLFSRGRAGDSAAGTVVTRDMPYDLMTELWQDRQKAAMYDAIRAAVPERAIVAAGVLISGCQDSQLSQETPPPSSAGVMTSTLARVWANNTWDSGSFDKFHRVILSQMKADQTPNLVGFGQGWQQLMARTPFNR